MSSSPETTPAHHNPGDFNARLLFLFIGLVEGLVWWGVDPFGLDSLSAAKLGMCAVFLVTSAALVARFTWDGVAFIRWGTVALGLALLVAAVTLSVWGHLPQADAPYEGDSQRIFAWAIGAFVLLYVTVPFAQIFQGSGRFRFPYSQLFGYSWNNFFIGLVAVLFSGIFWSILGIWAALFNLIGISFFSDLFETKAFAYISTFAVFGYGLSLGRANEGVILSLRHITLMIAQALLPLVAFVALLFLAALPFTGLEPLWGTGQATPLVLVLLAFLALLLNGVYEEGERRPNYPAPLIRAIEGAVLTMPAFAAIGLYGTALRVSQYGLTPQRVYALLFVGVASVYALGYAAAVLLRRPPWMGMLKSVNVGAALLIALLVVLVQLPPLDPLRLSADSQAARLRDERVQAADFDFATLRFKLGHYGWERLMELEGMTNHPETEVIRKSIELVRVAESFWQTHASSRTDLAAVRFRFLPGSLTLPDGLLEAMAKDRTDLGTGICSDEGDCLILGADLDRDNVREYCLLGGSGWWYTSCYAKSSDDSAWAAIGSLAYRGGRRPTAKELEAALGAGPLETRTSHYRDLVAPGGVLELVPSGFTVSRD
jgi:hypothetical protein